jgi:erythronate-4-phosphate dehydrogenase
MIRIIADEKIPFLKGVFESFADIIYLPWNAITRNAILTADAILVRTPTICDHTLLDGTSVKFIGTPTAGFDHIDTNYCRAHSIHVVNAPGCNANSVMQYISSALLLIAEKNRFTLKDQTLGIVGVGKIGTKIEKLAQTFRMKVLLNDPPREREEGHGKYSTFRHLLESSDILTIHVPLNKEGQDKTWHLIDPDALHKMKPNAWLINSARGEVIDSAAMKTKISSGKFPAMVFDVWENEPRIDLDLLPYVFIATPHIAGYSLEGKANATATVVRQLGQFFHLPFDEWFPANIPGPDNPELFIDGKDKTPEQILKEAILHTYSIGEDDRTFRSDPRNFEQQRGNYPVRREFSAYHISLKNVTQDTAELLIDLGFSLSIIK